MPGIPYMPRQVGRNPKTRLEPRIWNLEPRTVGRIKNLYVYPLGTKVKSSGSSSARARALSCRILSIWSMFCRQRRQRQGTTQLPAALGLMSKLFIAVTVLFCTVTTAFKTGYDRRTTTNYRETLLHASNEPISTQESQVAPIRKLIKNAGVMVFPLLLQSIAPKSANAGFNDPIAREQRPEATDAAFVSNGNEADYKLVRQEIAELINVNPAKGPTLVRLAWHSSGTYSKILKDGGSSKGTIRFKEELAHGANAGLDTATMWLEPIYRKFNRKTDLTYADLYTLAGAEAISAMGGPKIPWRSGRVDSMETSDITPDGRLPEADKGNPMATAAGLREVFNRMGFNDQEIVALSGAHSLGRCHTTASGYVGPWSPSPTVFNNLYFVLLKGLVWTPNEKTQKLQYKDPTGKLMMLPSDLVLIQDEAFKVYVDLYAKDQKTFFKDFAVAFQKLEELGCENLQKT